MIPNLVECGRFESEAAAAAAAAHRAGLNLFCFGADCQ